MSDIIRLTGEVRESVKRVSEIAITKDRIAELSEYMSLKLTDVESTEEYEHIKGKWQETRRERLDCEKRHKEVKHPFTQIGKIIDDRKNSSVHAVKPVEDHLRAQMKRYEDHKEKAEREALEAATSRMLKAGYVQDGRNFVCGDILVSADDFKKNHTDAAQLDYWVQTGADMKAQLDEAIRKNEEAAELLRKQNSEQPTSTGDAPATFTPQAEYGNPSVGRSYRIPHPSVGYDRAIAGGITEASPTAVPGTTPQGSFDVSGYNAGLFDAAKLVSKAGHNDLAKEILSLRK